MHAFYTSEGAKQRERERQRECLGGEGVEGKEGNRYHSVTVLLVSQSETMVEW